MVLCWIALPILAIMGIFSIKYRNLAVESFDCLFRNITLRKCRSSFDERIKGDITGKLMKFSPSLAKGFFRYYKLISVVFLIILVLSTYFSVVGIYNYVRYGNCNGEGSEEFCIIRNIEEGIIGTNSDDLSSAVEHGTLNGAGCEVK